MKLKTYNLLITAYGIVCFLTSLVAFANIPDYYEEPGQLSKRLGKVGQMGEIIDPFGGGLQLYMSLLYLNGNGDLDINVGLRYQSGRVRSGI